MASGTAVRLHLLRHADAGDPDAWSGPDAERPLSDNGREQSERLGRFLAGVGFASDAIVSSPKARARQTAEIVAQHLGVDVRIDDALAEGPSVRQLEEVLARAGDPRRPVLVGHDPTFSELAAQLSGSRDLALKKGALVRLDGNRPFGRAGAALRWLVPPDLLAPSDRP